MPAPPETLHQTVDKNVVNDSFASLFFPATDSIFSDDSTSGSGSSCVVKQQNSSNDVYISGEIGGDAGIIVYTGASDTFDNIPIHLSSSGSDRLLGIAPLSGNVFAVAGEVNADAVVRIVDLTNPTPSVYGGITLDVNSAEDVFFDLGLSRDGTTAYAVGRGAIYAVTCKVAFPNATPVTAFNTGCEGNKFSGVGGQAAEAHQVVALNNGDIAMVGTVYIGSSLTPRMFIAVVNGTTGAADPAFDGDGLWVEGISGSTQSEGWGIAAMNFGFAAVGWADISGQRELIMPVFDGLQPDTRYPNSGIVEEAIGTNGHATSVELVTPASTTAPQDFDFAVGGDENDGADAFVIQYQGVWPDSIFDSNFDQ